MDVQPGDLEFMFSGKRAELIGLSEIDAMRAALESIIASAGDLVEHVVEILMPLRAPDVSLNCNFHSVTFH